MRLPLLVLLVAAAATRPAAAATSFTFVRSDFATGTDDPIGLAAGDFNEDGFPDLVAAGWDDLAVVLRNDGTGAFTALTPTVIGAGLFIFWTSTLDYDRDGHLDVVTANLATDFITILRGDGNGGLSWFKDIQTGIAPIHVASADLDKDGLGDLVVCNSGETFLTLLFGDGSRAEVTVPGFESHNTVLRDYDEDGDLDIAVSFSDLDGTVGLLLNNGGGVFAPMITLGINLGYHIDSGDFNGDGHDDLVTAPLVTTEVYMLLGDGKGNFSTTQIDDLTGAQNDTRAADLDCDGIDDALVVGETESHVYSGTAGIGLVPNGTIASGPESDTVALADYDLDGVVDLAFPELMTPGTVAAFANTTVILHCPKDQTIDPGPACVVDPRASTCDVTLTITSDPALPAQLPLGPNTILWTAVDPDSNKATCSATITVIDTTAPLLSPVPDVSVECPAVPPTATPTWTDCDPDATLALKETTTPGRCQGEFTLLREWTATDTSGNFAKTAQTVTVRDTMPPDIVGSAKELGCLWPPNHWYVCLSSEELGISASDSCSNPVALRITGCTSNQPDDAPDARSPDFNGDGHTTRDCFITTDGRDVCVRAERAGSGPDAQLGRRYGIKVVAEDACGNRSVELDAGWIRVPHDQSPAEKSCIDSTKRGCRPNESAPCPR